MSTPWVPAPWSLHQGHPGGQRGGGTTDSGAACARRSGSGGLVRTTTGEMEQRTENWMTSDQEAAVVPWGPVVGPSEFSTHSGSCQ